ncbi:MAG: hypothetical protein HFI49_04780 [Bacilli bacterium]|jgi:hypothetical protein|nr:hypothetical protein [Bacilli bacterium]
MGQVYDHVTLYKKKFPGGVTWWRLKKHANVIEQHLNPGEYVKYAFAGQKNDKFYDLTSTAVIAITNKRILIGQKRVVWGYFLSSITPDLYNDMQVYQGLIWGKITIDTVKEVVVITNLSKDSLREIETEITEFMMEEKKKYARSLKGED